MVLLVASASAGVASAFAATIADWEMNEPSGATTMVDSSGSNLSGTIGSAVVTGVVTDGATGYRWLGTDKAGVHPERLVTVDSSLLNPGTEDFAVTVRFYTGSNDQNILQKGQTHASGGMWKIAMKYGKVNCNFIGSEHQSAIWSSGTVSDNAWHTVRCERRPTGVTIIVDGGAPRTNRRWTGNVANTWPLAIGGKPKCDAITVECDYFVGRIDYVVIERLDPIDATKPQVELTSPPDGSVVPRGSTVNLAATASDDVGVARVDFKVNGSLKCSDTEAPYTCSWRAWTASGTKNTLRAIAYDAVGNSATDTVYVYTQ